MNGREHDLPPGFESSSSMDGLLRINSGLSTGWSPDDLHGGFEHLALHQPQQQSVPGPASVQAASPLLQSGSIPLPNLLQAAAMLDPQHQQQVVQRVAEQHQLHHPGANRPLDSLGAPLPPAGPQALLPTSATVLQMQQSLIGLLASAPALPVSAPTAMPMGLPVSSGDRPSLVIPLPGFQPQPQPVQPLQQVPQPPQLGLAPTATSASSALGLGAPFAPNTVLPPPNYMVPLDAAAPLQPASSAGPAGSQQHAQQPQVTSTPLHSMYEDGATAGQGPEPPRRRGRKPKAVELLSEKQLRAREAQKRFRDRQKNKWKDAEESIESVSAELEQERAQHESARLTNAVYERMLEYKEQMMGALSAAHEFDPPPGIVIPPEMVEVMRKEGVTQAYTPESIMRYAPAGYTDHLDDSGKVKEAPPFEVVAKDWTDIVEGLRRVVVEALVSGTGIQLSTSTSGGGANGGAAGGGGAVGGGGPGENGFHARTAAAMAAAAKGAEQQQRSGRPPEARGLRGQRESVPGELVELEGSARSAGASGAGAAAQQQRQQLPAGGAATGAAAAAQQDSRGSSPSRLADEEEARRRPAEHLLARSAASKKLPWAELDKGLELQDGEDLYRFTGPQLRVIAKLLKRVGALSWQQAILFPDNVNKLVATRMDTCEVCCEEEDLPRWRHVVRQLRLRPSQLEALVALHSEFLSTLRPALIERRSSLHRLQELNAGVLGTSQQNHLNRTLVVSECTAALIHSVQVQNAASVSLTSGLFNLLDFPLQKVKLILLAWPFYPQVHLVGTAAAMELGLDMSLYASFNLLDLHQSDGEEEEGDGEGSRDTATPGSAAGTASGGGTAAAAAGAGSSSVLGSALGAAAAQAAAALQRQQQAQQAQQQQQQDGDDDLLMEVKMEDSGGPWDGQLGPIGEGGEVLLEGYGVRQ